MKGWFSNSIGVIEEIKNLFTRANTVHFFTDGGPHHYKSRHGILGFVQLALAVRAQMSTNAPPRLAFHFHASYHGSDICDCVASLNKRAIKNFSLASHRGISNGEDLVEALGGLKGEFISTTLEGGGIGGV